MQFLPDLESLRIGGRDRCKPAQSRPADLGFVCGAAQEPLDRNKLQPAKSSQNAAAAFAPAAETIELQFEPMRTDAG
jgi:hypothetical protein